MPTAFESLSEKFYSAYFEPDTNKRKKAISKWVDSAVPVLQKAIKTDLNSYIDQILETRWTDEGWQSGVTKFLQRLDEYKLVMNIQITDTKHMKYIRTVDPVSPKEREKTLRLAEAAIPKVDKMDVAKSYLKRYKGEISGSLTSTESDDDWSESDKAGRSPNDDRSDSMNPNNPASQATDDNRSNQMNPNNPAYHSSRGHGRR